MVAVGGGAAYESLAIDHVVATVVAVVVIVVPVADVCTGAHGIVWGVAEQP